MMLAVKCKLHLDALDIQPPLCELLGHRVLLRPDAIRTIERKMQAAETIVTCARSFLMRRRLRACVYPCMHGAKVEGQPPLRARF